MVWTPVLTIPYMSPHCYFGLSSLSWPNGTVRLPFSCELKAKPQNTTKQRTIVSIGLDFFVVTSISFESYEHQNLPQSDFSRKNGNNGSCLLVTGFVSGHQETELDSRGFKKEPSHVPSQCMNLPAKNDRPKQPGPTAQPAWKVPDARNDIPWKILENHVITIVS